MTFKLYTLIAIKPSLSPLNTHTITKTFIDISIYLKQIKDNTI